MGILRWLFQADDQEERFNTRDGWGISKNFYSVLGLIAAEGARTEFLLGALCVLLTSADEYSGQVLVANLGYRSRLDVIWSILNLKDDQPLEADIKQSFIDSIEIIKSVLKEVENAYPKRNFYVHGVYTRPHANNSAVMYSIRAKSKLRVNETLIDISEMYAAYLQILDARVRLAEVVRQLDAQGMFHSKEPEERDGRSDPGIQDRSPTSLAPEPLDPEPKQTKVPRKPRLSSAQKRAASKA